jgi:hypothetical protein
MKTVREHPRERESSWRDIHKKKIRSKSEKKKKPHLRQLK